MGRLHCTLIQADLHWEDKEKNLLQLEQMLNNKSPQELVILPEMFNTGFSMRPEVLAETMEGETVQWMRRMASRHRIILAGSLIIQENNQYFNRLIWMQPDGAMATYDKRHRFALAGEDQHFAAGEHRLVTQANGWRILWQICYDLRFPVWSRQQTLNRPEYDLLVYVANWPDKRAHAWRSLLIARAIENQCYVIGVNRVGTDGNGLEHLGDSMVVDPMGQVLVQLTGKPGTETVVLDKNVLEEIRSRLPFWKDADAFSIIQSIDRDEQ
ncbi:MAG: amidohydrolase [Bacteroidota bacterium]